MKNTAGPVYGRGGMTAAGAAGRDWTERRKRARRGAGGAASTGLMCRAKKRPLSCRSRPLGRVYDQGREVGEEGAEGREEAGRD